MSALLSDRRRPGRQRTERAKILTRLTHTIDWPLALPLVGLVFGLWRGWLQPSLHHTMSAFDLGVILPFTDQRPVSWALVVVSAIALLAMASLSRTGTRPDLAGVAAALATTATVGFMVQSCVIDNALQNRLARDTNDLHTLRLIAGFTIPRPRITTLGPIPVSHSAADVLSGLRSGYYASLAASVVLVVVVIRRHSTTRSNGTRRSHTTAIVATLMASALVVSLAEGALADRALRQARLAAAVGDDSAAAREFRSAIAHGHGVGAIPDVVAEYGMTLIRRADAVGADQELASSRLLLDGGHDLTGLRTISAASRRWPGNAALRDEFVDQAVRYLRRRGAPEAVHREMPGTADSPVLRLALARYEIVSGDNPAAIADARSAIRQADDTEVQSIGLTFLALAQMHSGDPLLGRRTLRAAVRADVDYVNVMARSLLTGLYTTLPL